MKASRRYLPVVNPRKVPETGIPARNERWFNRLLSLPNTLLQLATATRCDRYDGHSLDVTAQVFVNRHRRTGAPDFDYCEAAADKDFWDALLLDIDARWSARTVVADRIARVSDVSIPVEGGEIALRICIPQTRGTEPLPVILYNHGGAFMLGSINSHEGVYRYLSQQTGAIVVGVDYRLAPSVKFPTPMNDVLAAYRWCKANIAGWGGDTSKLVVAGDSAGSMLSINLCYALREAGEEMPVMQALLYPYTDIDCDGDVAEDLLDDFILSRSLFDAVPKLLLEKPEDKEDLRLNVTKKMAMEGMPPTLVVTAGFDPLRDQGKWLHEKIQAAGGESHLMHFPTLTHSFMEQFSDKIPAARTAFDNICSFIKTKLH